MELPVVLPRLPCILGQVPFHLPLSLLKLLPDLRLDLLVGNEVPEVLPVVCLLSVRSPQPSLLTQHFQDVWCHPKWSAAGPS